MIHKTFTKHLVWCILVAFFTSQSLLAQQKLNDKIPFDGKVKTGILKNGIKYYIRKNAKPENRVELRLAVNAGSMQENEDQQGLAHFVEHMAFNGTKNFKKNELVNYLQSVGVKFGRHLNAYTSFDETVYMLQLPTDKKDVMNTGFQILEDWAHNVNYDNEEIDKERGVVIEEWRLGRGAGQRMRDRYFPLLLNNSRYAKRLPIGKKEVLDNFKYKTIKNFYKDWYRPDLMAVIVVGDIDVDAMEKKIKKQFSGIKPVKNPRKKELYPVPSHDKTFIAIETDKEAPFSQVDIYYKRSKEDFKVLNDYRKRLTYQLYTGMLNQRLNELTEQADPPFVNGSVYNYSFVRTMDSYNPSILANEKDILKGLKALLIENKRAQKFGFTKGEFERYKKVILNRYERGYKERKKTNSTNYAREYVAHFLSGAPAPGIEFEYEFVKKQLPTITLSEVNALSKKWITKENRVIVITAPEKKGVNVPTKAQVEKALKEVAFNRVKPYVDKAVSAKLMDKTPKPGKVVATKKFAKSGVTELTLSNGIKVRLKPTKFKDNQIMFDGFSWGGYSLANDADHMSATMATGIVGASGVSKFEAKEMRKMMVGKTVRVRPYIGETSEGINGSTTPKDLETALQMVYLYFTSPRRDETAFKAMMAKNKSIMSSVKANPNYFFYSEMGKIMSQNHPRASKFLLDKEDFEKIKLDRALAIYKERFADASDFKFTFVGNFEVDKIKPLLETYLGSLPTSNSKETYKDLGIRPPKGVVDKKVYKGTDPKSMVQLTFTGKAKYNGKDKKLLSALAQLLSIKLIEELREKKGGVYGAGARASMGKIPYERYSINISFPCAPKNAEELVAATMKEIEKLKKNGVSDKDLNKVKEQQKRSMQTNMENNRYWMSSIRSSFEHSETPEKIVDYQKGIDALNSKDMQKAAKKFFDMKNYIKIVLYPENMKK